MPNRRGQSNLFLSKGPSSDGTGIQPTTGNTGADRAPHAQSTACHFKSSYKAESFYSAQMACKRMVETSRPFGAAALKNGRKSPMRSAACRNLVLIARNTNRFSSCPSEMHRLPSASLCSSPCPSLSSFYPRLCATRSR